MSNIHSLSSLKRESKKSENSDEENEDKNRQGFYVGGSNHSGQQILGPTKNNKDVVSQLFDAAKNAGAEQISAEEANNSNLNLGSSSTFQGGVYRLGGHGQDSQFISENINQNSNRSVVTINLNVWENGFSLDDGPLCQFSDPENALFLEDISKGRIPRQLIQQYGGQKIDFHMIKKNSVYVAPKLKPFVGQGHRLGSIVPTIVDDHLPKFAEAKKIDNGEIRELLKNAQDFVNVQPDKELTRVQIRFPSHLPPIIGVFNIDHTISDLRNFIVSAQPYLAYRPFVITTTYPTKNIENESKTLKEAGLLNAVVIVKFI